MPKELTQALVEKLVAEMPQRFTHRDLWNELNIKTTEGKGHLRKIMWVLTKEGVVRKHTDGSYRQSNLELMPVEWEKADPNAVVPLLFPFRLENYAVIYPKSIIVVAGSKNAGKTAWLYNFIALNMYVRDDIVLFNSETGPEQMQARMKALEVPMPAPFKTYDRYDDYADVTSPTGITVIDYLDVDSDFYMIGAEINAIFHKLTTGVAVIAIQKPPPSVTFVKGVKKVIPRDLGYGGALSAKRAALYISMDSSRVKVLHVKTPANPLIPHPDNMTWSFNLDTDGVHFKDIKQVFQATPGEGDW